MSYDFYIGQFLNGEGLDRALDRGIDPVAQFATGQVSRIANAFKVGGHQQHGGERWKELADSTIKRKGHSKILIDKGVLRASTFFRVIRAIPAQAFVVDIGTNVLYARHHQRGGGRVPQRKVISVTREDQKLLAETFELWAEFAINGPFRNSMYKDAA